jgi:hypothetical protein
MMTIFKVLLHPAEAMEEVAERPKLIVPAVFNGTMYFILLALMWMLLEEEIILASGLIVDMEITSQLNNFKRLSMVTTWISFMFAVIVKALFIDLIARFAFKQSRFVAMLSAVLHAMTILVIGELVYVVVRILYSDPGIRFSLALLLGENTASPFASLLNYFDVFTIWFQCIVIIGVTKVYKIPLLHAAAVVLLPIFAMLIVTIFR